MKTKTYMADDVILIDKLSNEWNEEHNVKFTQTGTVVIQDKAWHKVVLFYEDK